MEALEIPLGVGVGRFDRLRRALTEVVEGNAAMQAAFDSARDASVLIDGPRRIVQALWTDRIGEARAHLEHVGSAADKGHKAFYYFRALLLDAEIFLRDGNPEGAKRGVDYLRSCLSKKFETKPERLEPDPRDSVSAPIRFADFEGMVEALEAEGKAIVREASRDPRRPNS